ncbi:MAG: RpiB/LacA/LacB family sugar-phosphate isomerase [Clostridiales bacterium]|nr:RpiB/LacA/LacB family sugar-phosphate isomerase [Clostridiales bacterium]
MVILTCDHGGFYDMEKLMKYFDKYKIEYKYMGPKEFNKEDDYPDFTIPACKEVLKNEDNVGIFMCGSGIGVNMVANRFKGIRAVCAYDPVVAFFARKDEDANVLTLGSRMTSFRSMIKIIKMFLTSEFEGGRHARRIAKY